LSSLPSPIRILIIFIILYCLLFTILGECERRAAVDASPLGVQQLAPRDRQSPRQIQSRQVAQNYRRTFLFNSLYNFPYPNYFNLSPPFPHFYINYERERFRLLVFPLFFPL